MAKKKINDDPRDYPALGRWMTWVDRPGSAKKLIWLLAIFCGATILANLTYSNKGHYSAENILGFYAVYGFVAFSFIIFAAKALRELIKRPEDYYGKRAIDREEYPEDQLERKDHARD